MSTQYKATCKCGATIDVPYSDNFKDWLNSHKDCLKQQAMPRTWVGLTYQEIKDGESKEELGYGFIQGALWAETKLKEKHEN